MSRLSKMRFILLFQSLPENHGGPYRQTRDKFIKFPFYLFVCLLTYLFIWWQLTPLSIILQLYRGCQFYWWIPGENLRPVVSHWWTLSDNVVYLALIEIRTHNFGGDRH